VRLERRLCPLSAFLDWEDPFGIDFDFEAPSERGACWSSSICPVQGVLPMGADRAG
jgi:hypothetical protein